MMILNSQVKTLCLLLMLISGIGTLRSNAQSVKRIFADAEKQTTYQLDLIPAAKAAWQKNSKNSGKPVVVSPRSITPEGELILVPSKDWTSGFFPGVLWQLFEYTGDKKWESKAREFTAKLANYGYRKRKVLNEKLLDEHVITWLY